MDNKYLTIRLGDLKAIVNKLAVKMMLTVIIPGYDDIEEGQVERRNVLAACYNDGIRCFAENLNDRLEEETQKQE